MTRLSLTAFTPGCYPRTLGTIGLTGLPSTQVCCPTGQLTEALTCGLADREKCHTTCGLPTGTDSNRYLLSGFRLWPSITQGKQFQKRQAQNSSKSCSSVRHPCLGFRSVSYEVACLEGTTAPLPRHYALVGGHAKIANLLFPVGPGSAPGGIHSAPCKLGNDRSDGCQRRIVKDNSDRHPSRPPVGRIVWTAQGMA